ncbi:TetR family transcriptional regulator [Planotetraspora thailandica]|uniref:TetR family transcriptional regulator n=1 Tax=Planotetraspora thailandica TaxID=487172 RepID=A0A8J3XVU4_9ACTN|nr:TetR/AcrR family transcriptional regulator [Planotetraspora thailandica]GII54350.1 TetR family transcriptional regulator [Planotetraspora thailandica]
MTQVAPSTTRDELVRAAADLLVSGGPDAVTTRAVSTVAGVQRPTIYRLFGDKEGLLDAVASFGLRDYLKDKGGLAVTDDPVEDLREAWDLHVSFGLQRPAFYVLAFVNSQSGRMSTASAEAFAQLRRMIARIGEAGRLRMSVDRATALVRAGGLGVVCGQLAVPPDQRDPEFLKVARERALSAILADEDLPTASTMPSLAVALREKLANNDSVPGFTRAEHVLLMEWLDRLTDMTA